jgi:hypothetical protein
MPLPKNLSAYVHVKQILDAALAHNKVTYTLPTSAAATRWRQEAYYFRRLSQNAGVTLYDNFILKCEGPKVHIEKRAVAGTLITEDGTRIESVTSHDDIGGDFNEAERFAFNLARNLGLEVDDED